MSTYTGRVSAFQRKAVSLELKDAAKGTFRARFAVFNEVDKDGDVHAVGSFPVGKTVPISAYMHTSWNGTLPVGKGVIGANDREVWIDGNFFLETRGGADTLKVVKQLLGEMEWSYGYKVLDSTNDSADLRAHPGAKRIIKRQDVFEVSPVLVGAGSNTGTEWVKGARSQPDEPDLTALAAKAAGFDPELLRELARFERFADAQRISFVQVPESDVPSTRRQTAEQTLKQVCAVLGVKVPELKWFAEGFAASRLTFKSEADTRGISRHGEIWVRTDQVGPDLSEVIAHETFHVAKPGSPERDALAFGADWR